MPAETDLLTFDLPDILPQLERLDADALDALPFGVVAMDAHGVVTAYNRFESQSAGLSPQRVIGRAFFTDVAPCTNNFMVALRFETEQELDATIDYIFSFKMRPTPVRLRMLRSERAAHQYLLVEYR